MNQQNETLSPSPNRTVTNAKTGESLFTGLALTIAAAGGGGWLYWDHVGSRYVTTDNAYHRRRSRHGDRRNRRPG